MCIERNRDILFGRSGEKLRLGVTSATAAAMQLVLDSVGINRHGGVSSEGWRIQWEAVPPGQ